MVDDIRIPHAERPGATSRRAFLRGSLAAGGCLILVGRAIGEPGAKGEGSTVRIENFDVSGKSVGVVQVGKVIKSDAEWRKLLSEDSYKVTRREGTERAFSGKYADNHAVGIYRCICCGTAVYDSQTKFESGTGWPSFWQPISKLNVAESEDNTLFTKRTAVSCRRCDAHLGHVFDDGPKPTGLRYCMNSVALNFVAKA
jgi:peptide-methionine (R)-S-oxide reductase